MFNGEASSLDAILGTKTVKAPKPLKVAQSCSVHCTSRSDTYYCRYLPKAKDGYLQWSI